jgi:hypothetical protein
MILDKICSLLKSDADMVYQGKPFKIGEKNPRARVEIDRAVEL